MCGVMTMPDPTVCMTVPDSMLWGVWCVGVMFVVAMGLLVSCVNDLRHQVALLATYMKLLAQKSTPP